MLAELRVACARLQSLLELPEYKHPPSDPDLPQGFIQLTNVNCFFDSGGQGNERDSAGVLESQSQMSVQGLHNINLLIESGLLLGVAGEIGSGKSSLINAILGEVSNNLSVLWGSPRITVIFVQYLRGF